MQDKVNILIVEDEGIVAMELQESLLNEGFGVAGITDDGAEAIDIIKEIDVDLALLDINIKGGWDGIQIAEQIKKHKNIPVIFVTAYTDRGTFDRAKLTLPSAYLTKPFQISDLRKSIDLAMHHFLYAQNTATDTAKSNITAKKDLLAQENILFFDNAIFIKQNYKYYKITYENILYLKADGNYTYIFMPEKNYIIKYALQNLIDLFNTGCFIRVHRSFAINICHLNSFTDSMVIIDQEKIPLGRMYKDDFLKLFKKL